MANLPDKIFAVSDDLDSRSDWFGRWKSAEICKNTDLEHAPYLASTPARDIADRLVEALRNLWMTAGNVEVLALADTPETIALESALAGARIVLDKVDRERKEGK